MAKQTTGMRRNSGGMATRAKRSLRQCQQVLIARELANAPPAIPVTV
jgi:hypothetical protein